jgi:hypothetical protein
VSWRVCKGPDLMALEWSTPKKGSITVHLPPERHFAYGGPASVGSFARLSACRLDRSEDKA